jgi:hypothetical protein
VITYFLSSDDAKQQLKELTQDSPQTNEYGIQTSDLETVLLDLLFFSLFSFNLSSNPNYYHSLDRHIDWLPLRCGAGHANYVEEETVS